MSVITKYTVQDRDETDPFQDFEWDTAERATIFAKRYKLKVVVNLYQYDDSYDLPDADFTEDEPIAPPTEEQGNHRLQAMRQREGTA